MVGLSGIAVGFEVSEGSGSVLGEIFGSIAGLGFATSSSASTNAVRLLTNSAAISAVLSSSLGCTFLGGPEEREVKLDSVALPLSDFLVFVLASAVVAREGVFPVSGLGITPFPRVG